MTRTIAAQGRHESEGVRAPREEQLPGEAQTPPKHRSGSDRPNSDLDVMPEGEDELTDKNQDELGEDEDEALEKE
ncbi:MAG: hypothetical protein HOP16_04880 [Acidobacteria bacterium]|nr:hypothetical protein [Acidobacteriota bacterium]